MTGFHEDASLKQHLCLNHPLLLWHFSTLLQSFIHPLLWKGDVYLHKIHLIFCVQYILNLEPLYNETYCSKAILGDSWLHPALLSDSRSRRTLTLPGPVVAHPSLLGTHSPALLWTHPRNFLGQLNPLPFYSRLQEPRTSSARWLHPQIHTLIHSWSPPL